MSIKKINPSEFASLQARPVLAALYKRMHEITKKEKLSVTEAMCFEVVTNMFFYDSFLRDLVCVLVEPYAKLGLAFAELGALENELQEMIEEWAHEVKNFSASIVEKIEKRASEIMETVVAKTEKILDEKKPKLN